MLAEKGEALVVELTGAALLYRAAPSDRREAALTAVLERMPEKRYF